MKSILLLLISVLLSSCATYYALKNPRECIDPSRPNENKVCERKAGISLDEAIEIDAALANTVAKAVKENTEEKSPPLRHKGSDSEMCKGKGNKECSLKKGCICLD